MLVAACGKATAGDLDRTISFLGRDKQPRTLSCGGNLLALYTHEVHHRGGVATILDGWGVENDWSGLICSLILKRTKRRPSTMRSHAGSASSRDAGAWPSIARNQTKGMEYYVPEEGAGWFVPAEGDGEVRQWYRGGTQSMMFGKVSRVLGSA